MSLARVWSMPCYVCGSLQLLQLYVLGATQMEYLPSNLCCIHV